MSGPRFAFASPVLCLLCALVPACTIDFDAPFADSALQDAGDAGADVAFDVAAEAAVEAADDALEAMVEAGDALGDAPAEASEAGPCDNGVLDGEESDIDCGGSCPPCALGRTCGADDDCVTASCIDDVCCESSCEGTCIACSEGKTGVEDGVCAPVAPGTDPDGECSGGYGCREGACESCADGLQNGEETWIDCGGTCPPCSENCTNGSDDDGNGLIDCEDPLCSSFVCTPAVPAGWEGPVWLATGDTTATDCPTQDTIAEGGLGFSSFPLASCPSCDCDPPHGQSCPDPVVRLYDPVDCSGGYDEAVTVYNPFDCQSFQDLVQYDSARVVPATPAGGSCDPSVGPPAIEPFSWPDPALVCEGDLGAAGGGCENGASCVARPPSPYLPRLCMYQPGLSACPQPNQTRYEVYTGFTDTRDCAACTCSNPSGGECGGTLRIYGGTSCGTASNDVPMDGSCERLVGSMTFESLRYYPGSPVGSTCTPSGGEPTGKVEATGPFTVCCAP